MHNVLIVEDDSIQRELLEHTIVSSYPDWNVKTASSYVEAKEQLEESLDTGKPFTLFLLDIQLSHQEGDRGGFVFAKELRRQPVYFRTPILFLTAVLDEAGFALSQFHCYNYITKPYTSKDIQHQLEQMLLTGYLDNLLEIADTNRIYHRIRMNEIYTIETKAHTLTLHTANGSFVTREYTLKEILKILDSDFIQCHRRVIVNKSYIESYDRLSQYIKVGSRSVPIGRSYQKNLENLLRKKR